MTSAPPGAWYGNRRTNPSDLANRQKTKIKRRATAGAASCHAAVISAGLPRSRQRLYITTAENERENWQKIPREIHFVVDRKTL
jgi:hypothetical protein